MFGFGSSDSDAPDDKRFTDGIVGTFKRIVKGAAKWALIAGAIGLVLALPGAGVAGILSHVPLVGGLVSSALSWLGIGATQTLVGGAVSGLTMGAVGGAVIGALKGVMHFDEDMEVAQEKRAMARNNAMAMARNEAIFNSRMGGHGGVVPGMSPGMARGMGGRDFS